MFIKTMIVYFRRSYSSHLMMTYKKYYRSYIFGEMIVLFKNQRILYFRRSFGKMTALSHMNLCLQCNFFHSNLIFMFPIYIFFTNLITMFPMYVFVSNLILCFQFILFLMFISNLQTTVFKKHVSNE